MLRLFSPFIIWALCSTYLVAQVKDSGKEAIGQLEVSLIYATGVLPQEGKPLTEEAEAVLKKTKNLKFPHYRLLGRDTQAVLRSYENWATPVTADGQIMLSFEPVGEIEAKSLKLDLELWQARKKILKTDPQLKIGQPLFILGPPWRQGKIIIAVELLSLR